MVNPFPYTSTLHLGGQRSVSHLPCWVRKRGISHDAGEQVPLEFRILLQSLPWLHYTTALPSCFGIPCIGHKWLVGNRTSPNCTRTLPKDPENVRRAVHSRASCASQTPCIGLPRRVLPWHRHKVSTLSVDTPCLDRRDSNGRNRFQLIPQASRV